MASEILGAGGLVAAQPTPTGSDSSCIIEFSCTINDAERGLGGWGFFFRGVDSSNYSYVWFYGTSQANPARGELHVGHVIGGVNTIVVNYAIPNANTWKHFWISAQNEIVTVKYLDSTDTWVTVTDSASMAANSIVTGALGIISPSLFNANSDPAASIWDFRADVFSGSVGVAALTGTATLTATTVQQGTLNGSVSMAGTATTAVTGSLAISDFVVTKWRWRDNKTLESGTPNWLAAENTAAFVKQQQTVRLRMLVQNQGPYSNPYAVSIIKARQEGGAWFTPGATTAYVNDSGYEFHGVDYDFANIPIKMVGMKRDPKRTFGRVVGWGYEPSLGDDGIWYLNDTASTPVFSAVTGLVQNGKNFGDFVHSPTSTYPYRYIGFACGVNQPGYITVNDGYSFDSAALTLLPSATNLDSATSHLTAIRDKNGYLNLFYTNLITSDVNSCFWIKSTNPDDPTAWPADATLTGTLVISAGWFADYRVFYDPTNDYYFAYGVDFNGTIYYHHNKTGTFTSLSALPSQLGYQILLDNISTYYGGGQLGAAMAASDCYVFAIRIAEPDSNYYDIRVWKFDYVTGSLSLINSHRLTQDTYSHWGTVAVLPGLFARSVENDPTGTLVELFIRYQQNIDSSVEQLLLYDTSTDTLYPGKHEMKDVGDTDNYTLNYISTCHSGRTALSYIFQENRSNKAMLEMVSYGGWYATDEGSSTTQQLGTGTFASNRHQKRYAKELGYKGRFDPSTYTTIPSGQEFEIEIPVRLDSSAAAGKKHEFKVEAGTLTWTDFTHKVLADKEYIDANGTFPANWVNNNGSPAPTENVSITASGWGSNHIKMGVIEATGSWAGVDFPFTPAVDGYLWISWVPSAATSNHSLERFIDGVSNGSTTFASGPSRNYFSSIGPLTGGTTYTIGLRHTSADVTADTCYIHGLEFKANVAETGTFTSEIPFVFPNGYPALYTDEPAANLLGSASLAPVATILHGATYNGTVAVSAIAAVTAIGTQAGVQVGRVSLYSTATVDAVGYKGVTKSSDPVAFTAAATVSAAGTVFHTVQRDFRFRNDDGNETTATWISALNSASATILPDTLFRLRVSVENVSNQATKVSGSSLEYQIDGAGDWQIVGTTRDYQEADQQIVPPQMSLNQISSFTVASGEIANQDQAVIYIDSQNIWHLFYAGYDLASGFIYPKFAYRRSITNGATWSDPEFWDGNHDDDSNLVDKKLSRIQVATDNAGALVVWWQESSTIAPPGITFVGFRMLRSTDDGLRWPRTAYSVPNKETAYTEMLFNSNNDYLFIGSRYGGTALSTYNLQVSVSTDQGSSWTSYSINADDGDDAHHNMWVHGELDASDNLLLWYNAGSYGSYNTTSDFQLAHRTLAYPYTGGFPAELGDPNIVTIGGDPLPAYSSGNVSQNTNTFMWTSPIPSAPDRRFCVYTTDASSNMVVLVYENGSWTHTGGDTFQIKYWNSTSAADYEPPLFPFYMLDNRVIWPNGDGDLLWGMPDGKLQAVHDPDGIASRKTHPMLSYDKKLRFVYLNSGSNEIVLYEEFAGNISGEDADTTQQISSGTFFAANKGVTYSANIIQYDQDIPANSIVEYEYHLLLPQAHAVAGRTYCFRVYGLDDYDRYACFSVVFPSVNMSGEASLTAIPTTDGPQATLSAVATLSAIAYSPKFGKASLTASAEAVVNGGLVLPAAPQNLSGIATVEALAEGLKLALTNIAGQASVQVRSINSVTGAVDMTGTAATTATEPVIGVPVQASLVGTSVVRPTAVGVRSAIAGLFGECVIWRVRASVTACRGLMIVEPQNLGIISIAPLRITDKPGELSILEVEKPDLAITELPILHIGVIQQ